MNLSDLRGRERIEVAATQVIVVSADDDVFIGLPGQLCQYVVDRGASGFDVDVQREMKRVGEGKRLRLRGRVD